ncbi:hypothetical protein FC07_GL001977 [Loigolactobacillus bifermentans DSM 20003]|uniref:Uncharacterized protein n=2 Tax=Loigolactobacillus bifermentans TaxID=1607 RepID=A0A0R1GEP8_9LACO|nr:hypothetical protein FC07_GL001977 [Loigolactobacillus bifermentans DSM 20003]
MIERYFCAQKINWRSFFMPFNQNLHAQGWRQLTQHHELQAIKTFTRLSQQGQPTDLVQVGLSFCQGRGVHQDHRIARLCFQLVRLDHPVLGETCLTYLKQYRNKQQKQPAQSTWHPRYR